MRILYRAMFLLLMCTLETRAYFDKYGPFEHGQQPEAFPLEECQVVVRTTPAGQSFICASKDSGKARLKIDVSKLGNYCANVINAAGKPLSDTITIIESNRFGGVGEVYCADLNHDGLTDFVVDVGLGGCGVAAQNSIMVFALSADRSYRIVTLFSMCSTRDDFIDVRHDGTCQFIQTDFMRGNRGHDGKPHHFWIYHLFEIVGTELRPADRLITGFPKAVWWSFKENHQASN